MGFEYLEHTADVKIRCTGATFTEACADAARAFTNLLTDVNDIKPVQFQSVLLHGKDKEHLLVAFLQELVYKKDKGFVACSAALKQEGDTLSGTLYGDNIANYERSGDIKATTLSDLFVGEENGKVILEFVLDL